MFCFNQFLSCPAGQVISQNALDDGRTKPRE